MVPRPRHGEPQAAYIRAKTASLRERTIVRRLRMVAPAIIRVMRANIAAHAGRTTWRMSHTTSIRGQRYDRRQKHLGQRYRSVARSKCGHVQGRTVRGASMAALGEREHRKSGSLN